MLVSSLLQICDCCISFLTGFRGCIHPRVRLCMSERTSAMAAVSVDFMSVASLFMSFSVGGVPVLRIAVREKCGVSLTQGCVILFRLRAGVSAPQDPHEAFCSVPGSGIVLESTASSHLTRSVGSGNRGGWFVIAYCGLKQVRRAEMR